MPDSPTSAERAHGHERANERAKTRQPAAKNQKEAARGLTVLERQAEAERIEAEKEVTRRPRQSARRSQSAPCSRPGQEQAKDKNGKERGIQPSGDDP